MKRRLYKSNKNKPHLRYYNGLWYCQDAYQEVVAETPKDAWSLSYHKSKTIKYEVIRAKTRGIYFLKEIYRLLKGDY